MVKNVIGYPVRSRRRLLIGTWLIAALAALPAFAVQNPTIKLSLNGSFNGYTVDDSANSIEVRCVDVRAGTSKSSPALNGSQQVKVTLSNKKQLTRTLTFTDGTAEFGAVGPVDPGTKVTTVSVIAPMY